MPPSHTCIEDEHGICFECDKPMTPSQQAKAYGLTTLVQAARHAHISADTLRRWHKTKPKLFEVVCRYCAGIAESP